MSHTGRSILAFSLYIGSLGTVLVFMPAPLLSLLGLPLAKDYWVSISGMLLVGLSTYYAFAAYTNLHAFMRLTAIMRCLILPFFLVLVLLNMAPWPILFLGLVDLLFAGWTFFALKLDKPQIDNPAG